MNRNTYQATRRSIRDNGIRYTFQHAIDTDDTDTLLTCDDLINVMKETDWLSMRQQFARSGSASSAFKLTTTVRV
jgi:hypothetical protein